MCFSCVERAVRLFWYAWQKLECVYSANVDTDSAIALGFILVLWFFCVFFFFFVISRNSELPLRSCESVVLVFRCIDTDWHVWSSRQSLIGLQRRWLTLICVPRRLQDPLIFIYLFFFILISYPEIRIQLLRSMVQSWHRCVDTWSLW